MNLCECVNVPVAVFVCDLCYLCSVIINDDDLNYLKQLLLQQCSSCIM